MPRKYYNPYLEVLWNKYQTLLPLNLITPLSPEGQRNYSLQQAFIHFRFVCAFDAATGGEFHQEFFDLPLQDQHTIVQGVKDSGVHGTKDSFPTRWLTLIDYGETRHAVGEYQSIIRFEGRVPILSNKRKTVHATLDEALHHARTVFGYPLSRSVVWRGW